VLFAQGEGRVRQVEAWDLAATNPA
jgi:hypothetical protein